MMLSSYSRLLRTAEAALDTWPVGLPALSTLGALLASVVLSSAPALASSSGSVRCVTLDHTWRLDTAHNAPLNHGLVEFALSNYGKKIGAGECTDIPNVYLQRVPAKTFYQLGPSGGESVDYVWGNLVTTAVPGHVDLSSVLPGDIVQMRNVVDTFRSGNTTWTQSPSHHTAIVFGISPDHEQVCVLEQNPTTVGYGWYNLKGLSQGTMWFIARSTESGRPVY